MVPHVFAYAPFVIFPFPVCGERTAMCLCANGVQRIAPRGRSKPSGSPAPGDTGFADSYPNAPPLASVGIRAARHLVSRQQRGPSPAHQTVFSSGVLARGSGHGQLFFIASGCLFTVIFLLSIHCLFFLLCIITAGRAFSS